MGANYRDAIMDAARKAAQAHGYNGLNMRSLAENVGIKSASIYYHFQSKADLAAAVAKRYGKTPPPNCWRWKNRATMRSPA